MEILGCLAIKRGNKVIVRRLELAKSTIKAHVQNILRKLNLSDRVQAAIYAVQHEVPQPGGVQTADIHHRIGTPSRHAPKPD